MNADKKPIEERKDPQTYAILGAAMEVHKQLGSGFLEGVYQEALAKELLLRKIPYEREVELIVSYKGEPLACKYRADFLCFGEVIVEIKAICSLSGADEAQVINYLKATRKQRSLLINFGAPTLEFRRLVLNYPGFIQNLRKSAQSADE